MQKSQRVVPHSVRSLAELVGANRTQVGYLLTGERSVVDEGLARSIAIALGASLDDLFLPVSSPSRDGKEVSDDA
jgi:transcriptional regulator with XRE-family HTH domain